MPNLAIITMSEDDMMSLVINGAFDGIKYTRKVLPDDSSLKEDVKYNELTEVYRKASKNKEKYAFEKLTQNKK